MTLKDFAEALACVNRVGELAESRNHHPDIAISWNKVTLRLSTHSAGGLTAARPGPGPGHRRPGRLKPTAPIPV